ncbi:MAG: alpha/beta fold hydrolase [Cyclobacteriaceae bacterium]|nr:alpha/beta fold hydrolase [Cyclobacteriaceae bacterium]
MKKLVILSFLLFTGLAAFAQHGAGTKGKVLLIVSNPSVSKQTGWPIGVWAAEVTHPYWEFTEAGYTVEIASPDGGPVKFDAFSDPEDASRYSAFDLISLGFKKDPTKMALLENTLKLSTVNPDHYKAIFVCGGQGPMYTFVDNAELHKFFVDFYQTGKPVAAICHGTAILLKTKLPNGKYLVEGKRWTGFASSEEQYADNFVGMKIQPFRIEDEARKMPNSRFEVGAPFAPYAVQDGNLITGQQQNSGALAARLTLKALENGASRYPTYVLVHGAWADESAWGMVRNQLALKANVITINLKGHGIDLASPTSVTMSDYVRQVTEVINQQPGKVTLVGHSMAGMVISAVAEKNPAKIERLVYVAAYLPSNGEDLLTLSGTDTQSLVGGAMIFSEDKSAASIRKEVIVPAVCADCPDYMKEALVKYHKPEPTAPMSEKLALTKSGFGSVPKFYIATRNDQAVGYNLQQAMIRKNGSVKKVVELPTSHLPFVVQPAEFVKVLTELQ